MCFALRNVNIAELEIKTLPELRDLARDLELSGYSALKKQDLVFRLLQANTEQQGNIFSAGVLEIVEDGFGFLRQERFLPGNMDVYVSQSQIRRFGLRTGDMVSGQVRPPKDNEKYWPAACRGHQWRRSRSRQTSAPLRQSYANFPA